MVTIVAYDISKTRRRDKAAGLLKDYGVRVQYSVFECDLSAERLAVVKEKMLALINPRKDRVHFYPVCQGCFGKAESLGRVEAEVEL